MNKVAFYRHQETGNLHGADAIRRAAKRYTVNGKRAVMILPKDPANWSAKTLNRLGYDPVEKTAPLATDAEQYSLNGRNAEWVDGRWLQKWTTKARYRTREEAEAAVLKRLHRIADAKRDAGITVSVDGYSVPVRTDITGITRITGARMGGRASRTFVVNDGSAVNLSSAQIDQLFTEIDAHVQGCFDRWAQLITAVQDAEDPLSVDLETGWPGDE